VGGAKAENDCGIECDPDALEGSCCCSEGCGDKFNGEGLTPEAGLIDWSGDEKK
jgi:hypothetical protein